MDPFPAERGRAREGARAGALARGALAAAVALAWAGLGAASGAAGTAGPPRTATDDPAPTRGAEDSRGGQERGLRVERDAYAMGTRLSVWLEAATRPAGEEVIDRILDRVAEVEALLSSWRADTELAALNRGPVGAPRRVSASVFGWLAEARAWSETTDGAFDPVVGALVDAWDLRGEGRRPDERELGEALRRSGRRCFDLGSGARRATRTVVRRCPGAWIDAGAFGKGAALREAREVLRALGPAAGVESAVLDFGGQLLLMSRPGDGEGADAREWPIAIAHPADRRRPVFRLRVGGGSVATSGQSERSIPADGGLGGHVLDPRSGTPVPAWGTVTARADDPFAADVLATALFVMGPERGLGWLAEHPGVDAVFVRVARDEGEDDVSEVVACGRASFVERLRPLGSSARVGAPVGRGIVGCGGRRSGEGKRERGGERKRERNGR